MLARFENGYYLEVLAEIGEDDPEESIFSYKIYDEYCDYLKGYWTAYRNLELYHPLNMIDYILQFCNPKHLEGKYEILPYEKMDYYEMYLDYLEDGDSDGDWCLERQGTDYDDVRYYKTEEDAKAAMEKDVDYFKKVYLFKHYYLTSMDDYCELSGDEYFQRWTVYESPVCKTETEAILNDMQICINRTFIGIDEYACELNGTWVATKHLDNLQKLLNRLKEMI